MIEKTEKMLQIQVGFEVHFSRRRLFYGKTQRSLFDATKAAERWLSLKTRARNILQAAQLGHTLLSRLSSAGVQVGVVVVVVPQLLASGRRRRTEKRDSILVYNTIVSILKPFYRCAIGCQLFIW